jgi:hypothetical protein
MLPRLADQSDGPISPGRLSGDAEGCFPADRTHAASGAPKVGQGLTRDQLYR